MENLDNLEIVTAENPTAGGWNATSTSYPEFIGTGATEDEAKENLKAQITESEGSESPESTEAGSEG